MTKKRVVLKVRKAGLFSQVQDSGRMGYQAMGLPLGGALDRKAAKQANFLAGRPEEAAVLEITLSGPEIEFGGPLQIALTGGDLSPKINGSPATMYETLNLRKSDVLSFGARKSGCRAYLAFGGELQSQEWLGSRSALKIGDGFWPPGSRLENGDQLIIFPAGPIPVRSIKVQDRPFHSHQLTVRVMPGPEFSWFSKNAIDHFLTHAFTFGPECNRMGCRLEEAIAGYQPEKELISSGIVPGTIQVLPSGRPVVLLADAQTAGGYPRIANILDQDLDYLAQLAPGDTIRFIFFDQ